MLIKIKPIVATNLFAVTILKYQTMKTATPREKNIRTEIKKLRAYNEEKLRGGLSRALEKRPVEAEAVTAAVGRIQHKLQASGEREHGENVREQ